MLKHTFLTVLVLLACGVALMEGLPTSGWRRCLCKGAGVPFVNRDRVAKIEYHRSSSSCGQEELLVILRHNHRRCLNINGDQGRKIKQTSMEGLNHPGHSCLNGAFSKGNWTVFALRKKFRFSIGQ